MNNLFGPQSELIGEIFFEQKNIIHFDKASDNQTPNDCI